MILLSFLKFYIYVITFLLWHKVLVLLVWPCFMHCFTTGGPISACRTDSVKKTATNLGYVQAMPSAADDGTLTIRYEQGDVCDSDSSVQTSTRINFECSETPVSTFIPTSTISFKCTLSGIKVFLVWIEWIYISKSIFLILVMLLYLVTWIYVPLQLVSSYDMA